MWESDQQYADHVLAEAAARDGHWELRTTDGWCITTPVVPDALWQPAPGDTARCFGRGLGYPVRGVVILRGRFALVSRYRTEDQWEADCAMEHAVRLTEAEAKLEATRTARDARWAALPDEFQARHRRFMTGSPHYRRDYEEYELFCCEQAWAIVQAGVDDVPAFRALTFKQQRMVVPALDEGHSGNTLGMSLRLAHWWLTARENVAREHGALASLVGCKEYGCTHDLPAEPSC